MAMIGVLERYFNDETGSEIVEMALCVPLLFAVMSGVVYSSFTLYANHFVVNAAKEAARYAVVRGSTWNGTACQSSSSFNCTATGTDISNFVISELPPGLSSADLSVSTTWPGTTNSGTTCDTLNGNNSPNCEVSVQVNYSFTFPIQWVNQGVLPLTSSAEMTIVE
jgi:Flp pilus assembly protein TadG